MPNYNDSQYIALALRAICEQSYLPKEVIVVDDASTDNSVEVIEDLAKEFPFIRLVRNESNKGVNYSQNRGASLTTGDYLYLASANDLVLPGLFEKSMEILAQFPQAALSFTESQEVTAEGTTTHIHRLSWVSDPQFLSPQQIAAITYLKGPLCVGAPSSIIRKDLVPANEALIPELESFADWFLCQSRVLKYGCCYIPEPLVALRSLKISHSANVRVTPKFYRKTCGALFQRLTSPEYKDILPLLIQSRALESMDICGRTPLNVYKALFKANRKSAQSQELFWYLTTLYLQHVYRVSQTALQSAIEQKTKLTFHIDIFGLVKNLFDQAYARSFHAYDKTRGGIRKRFSGPDSEEGI